MLRATFPRVSCKGRTTHLGTTWSIFQQILQVLLLCCMSRGECFTPCLPLVFGVRRLTLRRPLKSAFNRLGRVAIATVHGVPLLSDVGAGLAVTGVHPNLRYCWWWVGDACVSNFLAAYPEASFCTTSLTCHGPLNHLFAPHSAVSDIDELQCFRLWLTLSEYGTCFLPRLEKPRRTTTCSALSRQMQFALDDKNLGKWALLQQCRIPWLPYDRHKGLHEARRFCYVHSWYNTVTPPSHLVHVLFHTYLSVLYIGQTHVAPVQRLRKHLTDAAAGVDNSTLHRLMATTDSADWGIGVLQYVGDTWWTAVRESAWWWQLRRWAVNDIPPGIPDPAVGVTSSARGWMNQKVLRVLRELRSAHDIHNYARAKFLQAELQKMGRELQVPLNLASAVVVPDVTVPQKTAICRVPRPVLRTTEIRAWQRQAYARLILLRSSPNKLHTVFDRAANKADLGATRPECCCHK